MAQVRGGVWAKVHMKGWRMSQSVSANVYEPKCMSQSVWDKVYEPKCMSQSVWDKVYEPKCMSQSVWDKVYEPKCMSQSVWAKVYEPKCMSQSVWAKMYEPKCMSQSGSFPNFTWGVVFTACAAVSFFFFFFGKHKGNLIWWAQRALDIFDKHKGHCAAISFFSCSLISADLGQRAFSFFPLFLISARAANGNLGQRAWPYSATKAVWLVAPTWLAIMAQ